MNCWLNHPKLCQLVHPWHWAAYGQNASILGLIGLIAYVLYTRRMMKAAEETRRLSLTPYLLAQLPLNPNNEPFIEISNVAAPAVRCIVWAQGVSENMSLGLRVRKPSDISSTPIASITIDKPARIPLRLATDQSKVLYVVDCFDTAGGIYQLQILQTPIPPRHVTIEAMFSIPDTFVPLWQRLPHRIRQAIQLWKYRKISKK